MSHQKTGPKCATQNSKAVQLEDRVLKQVDIGPGSFAPQRVGQLRQGMPVEFVVAQNVNDRFVRELLLDPWNALGSFAYVTRIT